MDMPPIISANNAYFFSFSFTATPSGSHKVHDSGLFYPKKRPFNSQSENVSYESQTDIMHFCSIFIKKMRSIF